MWGDTIMQKYVGDIYMITKINYELLKFIKNHDILDGDYTSVCDYVLAKKDAVLIKINDFYIDEDTNSNINFNTINNNCLLVKDVFDPYVGQLFVKDVKMIKTKSLKNTNN